MKVKENNKCSYCTDTVDVIEQFFVVECPVVRHLWNFIKENILRECGIYVKLHLTDIMFGVQRSNIKENIIKKINHIILIAKMCIRDSNTLCFTTRKYTPLETLGGKIC